jgi:hypothetical protein
VVDTYKFTTKKYLTLKLRKKCKEINDEIGRFPCKRIFRWRAKKKPAVGRVSLSPCFGQWRFGGYIIEKRRRLVLRKTDVGLTGVGNKYGKYCATILGELAIFTSCCL